MKRRIVVVGLDGVPPELLFEKFLPELPMIGIPFWGLAIETPRLLPVTACQPPFGNRKQLAGGARLAKEPHFGPDSIR